MASIHIEHTQCFQSSHATASGALFASAKLHRFSVTTGSQGGTCCEYLFVMLNTLYSSPPPPWSQRFTWIDSSQLAWTDCDRTTNKLEANLMTGNTAPSFSCQVQLLALVSSRQQLLQFMLRQCCLYTSSKEFYDVSWYHHKIKSVLIGRKMCAQTKQQTKFAASQ